LIHGLRGRPSNHRLDPALRHQVVAAYRQRYPDFGPTFACEKLAAEGGAQPRITLGASRCSSRRDNPRAPDISIAAKRRTFLLRSDKRPTIR